MAVRVRINDIINDLEIEKLTSFNSLWRFDVPAFFEGGGVTFFTTDAVNVVWVRRDSDEEVTISRITCNRYLDGTLNLIGENRDAFESIVERGLFILWDLSKKKPLLHVSTSLLPPKFDQVLAINPVNHEIGLFLNVDPIYLLALNQSASFLSGPEKYEDQTEFGKRVVVGLLSNAYYMPIKQPVSLKHINFPISIRNYSDDFLPAIDNKLYSIVSEITTNSELKDETTVNTDEEDLALSTIIELGHLPVEYVAMSKARSFLVDLDITIDPVNIKEIYLYKGQLYIITRRELDELEKGNIEDALNLDSDVLVFQVNHFTMII